MNSDRAGTSCAETAGSHPPYPPGAALQAVPRDHPSAAADVSSESACGMRPPTSAPDADTVADAGMHGRSEVGGGGANDGTAAAAAPGATTLTLTPAPVPDALLSLAKSARYVSYLSDLLSDLVAPYLGLLHTATSTTNSTNSADHRRQQRSAWKLIGALKPEMDLIAALLHATLLMWRQGRSMGMDVTGLRYCPDESLARRRRKRRRNGKGGASDGGDGYESLGMADAQLVSPPASAPSRLAVSLPPSSLLPSETQSLPEQLGTYSRSLAFVALTVLPPYLAARCGRAGGWEELRKLLFPVSDVGSSSSSTSANGGSNHMSGTEHGGVANNDAAEQLRGRSRREIFEERRRAMVQMASRIEERGDGVASDSRSDNRENVSSARGSDESGVVNSATSMTERQSQGARVAQKYLSILRRMCRNGTDWFRQANIATLSLPTAAHSISRNNMANSDNSDDDQMEAQADSRASILRWILRLNLALFYLNGKYPTLAHRMTGVRLSSTTPNSTTVSSAQGLVSPGLSDRPSYRMIGALILLEAGAALTGTMNRLLVEIYHRLEMKRAARRSNETTAGAAADADAAAAAERSRLLDLVEKRAPSVLTYEQKLREDESCSIGRIDVSSQAQQPASSSCGICMHDRKHPAAPISCGHVFCWSCIFYWSTKVRPECPLCRAPAKPQDIIALYNY